MSSRPIHPVMVGTAGHIDHGKSSLVQALTGIDPDRLKEEKERGMTIDLGFARLRMADGRWLGMVDVPGHERFVRNMVAGSTALDLALLVVAADDGVMPQTREHLDILDLIGVRHGLVALTKVDLVDAETVAMAQEEVSELLEGTGFEGAPVLPVSATTGEGVEELSRRLQAQALEIEPRSHEGPFRMPVQRVFQLKGIGTVVTGIPISGAVATGDEVEFLPLGHRSRVRAIQAYGGGVSEAVAGHSTALSVPDARAAGLRRGLVAATPDVFGVGDAVDVELKPLARGESLGHRTPIRFHTGTSEARGILLLLHGDHLEPGDTRVARVILDQEVCCAFGDRFLLRLQNPVMTVGGGQVLRLTKGPRRYRRTALGDELGELKEAGSRPEARILHELTQASASGCTAEELSHSLSLDEDLVSELLGTVPGVHVHPRTGRAFLEDAVEGGIGEVLASVDRMLKNTPQAASVKRSSLRTTRTLPQALKDAALDQLQAEGRIRSASHGRILFIERLKPLPVDQQRTLSRLVDLCETRGFKPPTVAELGAELTCSEAILKGLVARAVDEVRIEQVGEHFYAAGVVRQALRAIRENCLRHGEVLEIPELRDELGTPAQISTSRTSKPPAKCITTKIRPVRKLACSNFSVVP